MKSLNAGTVKLHSALLNHDPEVQLLARDQVPALPLHDQCTAKEEKEVVLLVDVRQHKEAPQVFACNP